LIDDILVRDRVVLRTISYGGITKDELYNQLINENICFNEYAKVLFKSDVFVTCSEKKIAKIVELTIQDLGFPNGAQFKDIFEKMSTLGLLLCPLEVGAYLRLSYMDQKEEIEIGKNKAPKGSITIFSKIGKEEDDDFPKGFYIRKMEGKLWLRGYICPMDYLWEPEARIALQI
jgi:hypothetical protein